MGQELWQPYVAKSAQLLHFCIAPSPLGRVFTPSPEGNSAGWDRQTERTGREPHPQSLSHIQPWPCQQFMWEKCGVGQKNQEQFICTGSEKASTDETKVISFLTSSDAWSKPEHLNVNYTQATHGIPLQIILTHFSV